MVNLDRRAGLGLVLAWLSAGCAAPGEAPPAKGPAPTGLLTPWITLTGGWRFETGAAAAGLPGVPGMPGMPAMPGQPPVARSAAGPARLDFMLPVALAARDDIVLVADMGLRQILRYERSRDSVTSLGPMPPDNRLVIQITPDYTAWLAEPGSGLVKQIDRNGRVLRVWRDDLYAGQPVGVAAVAEAGGDVYVADAQLAHIAVFNAFGKAFRRFGEGLLQSVTAMTVGPLGLYVVDRIGQQVVVFGRDGQVLTSMGEDGLVMPRAVAVDREGRVFVVDDADPGAIQVFFGGERVLRYTGSGAVMLRKIEALAVDGNLLYAADGLSGRIFILLITPESLRRPPQN